MLRINPFTKLDQFSKSNYVDIKVNTMKSKFISTVILMFSIITQIVAQSKKEQIESLNLSVDSLEQSLKSEKKITLKLENQLTLVSDKLQKMEHELVISNDSLLRVSKKTGELIQVINLLKDSIEIFRNSIKKSTSKMDLVNGTFNDEELNFIVNYFKEVLPYYSEEKLESKVTEHIYVHLEGELGYVPAIDFPRNYNQLLAGDLDKDGTNEILFNVEVTGGGTAYWGRIYCLKLLPNNTYLIDEIDVPCACTGKFKCRETNTEILSVKNNVLTIECRCFLDSDAECCPSSISNSRYQFINNELLLLK